MTIKENLLRIKNEIPDDVEIVLAAKTRVKEEIEEAISAGAKVIGQNYVQEAEEMFESLGEMAKKLKWHMIGSLQKNKINKALKIFDCFQAVDSFELAEAINKRAKRIDKKVAIFIEINIGSEFTKSGVKPEYETIKKLAQDISKLKNLKVEGLMTMGPRTGNPEKIRPYFKKTKEFFDKLKEANIAGINLRYLSMGMSNSYKIAIEEGANMVRLGTVLFGERDYGNI
ncbi:MAG: YggS family pyridoxal phosphate-dependent enzyme [Candidatus Omnitrophica bacterium]|nr:YggS family pyridoxal phosphate-dependent enzyme [Candidatus Omnitrophota bacterium]